MKKKVFAMILCLALVTALVIGLVACNNDEDAKKSNCPLMTESSIPIIPA